MRVFHKSLNVAGKTRSDARVASEGPRATVTGGFLGEKRPPFPVGRGPVPRHASGYRTLAEETRMRVWHPRGPALRYWKGSWQQHGPFPVGRGPVPRQASGYRTLAGETRSDARVASEGPRATVPEGFLHVRGGQALLGP